MKNNSLSKRTKIKKKRKLYGGTYNVPLLADEFYNYTFKTGRKLADDG
tara:strand:+ start:508 stop:651 length:144 start_codon:yes stop_codon:yes gene_type:complete